MDVGEVKMKKTIFINLALFFLFFFNSYAVFAKPVRLNYEFPTADAVYLNICSMEYRLNSGMCSKINIKNSKLPTKIGTIEVDVPEGATYWAVFVDDTNSSKYRYLYYTRNGIKSGYYYRFGPNYNNKVSKSSY